MVIDKDRSISAGAGLRRRAEEQLNANAADAGGISRADHEAQRLLHELQVHQIELEMQNVELRQARDDAEHSLEKYTDFYDFAPVGYFTLDCSGTITSVNLRGASLVDVARARLLGSSFRQLVTDEYRTVFTEFIRSVFINRDKTVCEVALLSEDKRPVIVLLEAMPAISGQECGLVLIDISDRKQAEKSLIISEARYRRITEGLTDYLYIVHVKNGHTVETTQSPACEKVTGYAPEEFDADPYLWIQMVAPEDQGLVRDRVHQILDGKEIPPIEHRIIRKDGELRWVRDTTILFKDVSGNLMSYDGMIQDITESKRAEEDLRNYARRLIEKEEELRNKLAAELHDEICRDLTVLGMNLAIIGDGMTGLAPKELIERVKVSGKLTKEISHTVRNIMVGLRPSELSDFGLPTALHLYADLFSKHTGIEVSIQVADPFPRFMVEKETALFRIAQEALINAAKHAATQIATIKLRRADDKIWLAVVDEGIGLLSASPLQNQNSTGWGMNIMRERTELMGGYFHVDSTPGKGTTVSVVMPVEDI